MEKLSDKLSLNGINFNEFSAVIMIYYYYNTNEILKPTFSIDSNYSNYLFWKFIFHMIRLLISVLIN